MPAHVLLVDDSTTVRMVIAAELREAGFRVTPVPTLDTARRALTQSHQKERFQLAILDVQLPDGDGIDLLREIRLDPIYSDLPVMILSGDSRFSSRLRGLGVGADDFVGKPHSKAYLIGRAQALTGGQVHEEGISRSWRVLLVESDVGVREALARVLRVGHGCDVVALENIDQAAQYLDVEGMGADCAIVERRSFLRMLGLLQGKRPQGVPVIVLDDSPQATWPAPVTVRKSPVTSALIVPRFIEASVIAEAVLRRLVEMEAKQSAASSATIPKQAVVAARRLARGA